MFSLINLAFSLLILAPVLAARHPQGFSREEKLTVVPKSSEVYTVTESSTRLDTHDFRQWSSGTYPNPIRDPTACGRKVESHICDPEACLSAAVADNLNTKLQRFSSKMKSPYCTGQGYQVYVGTMHNIDGKDDLRKFAQDLGHQWGVLGGPCSNGIVALYSMQGNGNLAIEVDDELKAHVFSPKLVDYLERSPLGVLEQRSADEVIVSLVSEIDMILDGSINSHPMVVIDNSAMALFYAPVGFMGLFLSCLMLCCVYDTLLHWRHRSHFMSCAKKLEKVHEVFVNKNAELPLCPICVNSVTNTASSHVVVFLCGHRFHTDCSNRYFREHPGMSGRCPICELPHSMSCGLGAEKVESHNCESMGTKPTAAMGTLDEMKTFCLSSLRQQYPTIISETSEERWKSCHTEIWLAELKCPRYQTLFGGSKKADHLLEETSAAQLSSTV